MNSAGGMNNLDVERFMDSDWSYFSDKQEQFDSLVRETVRTCGPGILSLSKKVAEQILASIASGLHIGIEVVLDTNVLFREVFNSIRGRPGFLSDFVDSFFFAMYGPPELAYEIHEKINQRIEDNSENEAAHALADEWLMRIKIVDYPQSIVRKQLLRTLRERDSEDVPFLALALKLRTHAILTGDSDFDSQSQVFVLKLKNAREIWYEFSKGSLSICAIGASVAALELLGRGLILAMDCFLQLIRGLVEMLSAIVHGSWEAIIHVPGWVWGALLVSLGIAALACVLSPEVSNWFQGAISKAKAKIEHLVNDVKTALVKLVETVMGFAQAVTPYVGELVLVYGYLGYCSLAMISRISSLEKSRPTA